MSVFVGIDVSKNCFDIEVSNGTSWSAPNQAEEMDVLVDQLAMTINSKVAAVLVLFTLVLFTPA